MLPIRLDFKPPKTEVIHLSDYKGYKRNIVYHEHPLYEAPLFSWYCGYVTIPKNHPYYDIEDDELNDERICRLKVHGGITYLQEHILGFDCGHFGDDIITCNQEYVENEINSLIDQLEKLER